MPKRPSEAIFKGFDGESVIGPARVYLKPYRRRGAFPILRRRKGNALYSFFFLLFVIPSY
ncbi:MAG: hypothetical protein GTO24_22405 [candidate division Zixibacteria bacterium]|nr:hypothetical protein [candidate division Zixibacteria bacterium]